MGRLLDQATLQVSFQYLIYGMIQGNDNYLKTYYTFVKEIAIKDKEAFKILKDHELNYLKKICKDYENNTMTRSFGVELPSFNTIEVPLNDQKILVEKNLRDFLYKNNVLEKALGITAIKREVVTTYGVVDILYSDEHTKIPCELKIGVCHHDIVSQIEKYIQHFWMKLHLGFCKKVYGITIVKDYDYFSFKELKKLDVLILKYKIDDDNGTLILEEVK